jgi:hypothetical protein
MSPRQNFSNTLGHSGSSSSIYVINPATTSYVIFAPREHVLCLLLPQPKFGLCVDSVLFFSLPNTFYLSLSFSPSVTEASSSFFAFLDLFLVNLVASLPYSCFTFATSTFFGFIKLSRFSLLTSLRLYLPRCLGPSAFLHRLLAPFVTMSRYFLSRLHLHRSLCWIQLFRWGRDTCSPLPYKSSSLATNKA